MHKSLLFVYKIKFLHFERSLKEKWPLPLQDPILNKRDNKLNKRFNKAFNKWFIKFNKSFNKWFIKFNKSFNKVNLIGISMIDPPKVDLLNGLINHLLKLSNKNL